MHPKTLLIAATVIALPGFLLFPRLAAQDVTVTPLQWAEPEDAPDQLPVENKPLRPRFPPDLRNTPDPGYVILEIVTDEKGTRRMFRPSSTLPAYENAVLNEADYWKLKPGRRLGHPVSTFTRCAVIFNPASADAKKPDATPRLLSLTKEVVDPSRKTPKNEPSVPPEVVWATVSLDARGEPTQLKDAPPALAELLNKAVHEWRFAPARRGGQPVAADLRVPFIVVGHEFNLSGESVLPKVIERTKPEYPLEMRKSGLRGEVLVDFVVDIEGRVTKAYVVRSLNPAFDEPALKSVRQWKFEPGRKGGVPVKIHMRVPIMFMLEGEWEGGDSGLEVSKKAKQADLPPELRYDVAPKPRNRVLPVYPYELLRMDVKGAATVRFLISETGKVIQAEVSKATHPAFGAAALAMIEEWEFEPALKDGRPTRSVFSFEQEFSPDDEDLVPAGADDMLALERKHPERIVNAGKLDARLTPTSTRPPIFPVSLRGKAAKGEATVEVLIDKEGRAQLPRVVSASDPAFGWAAVQAVTVWRFEPPAQGGKTVVTQVRIPFKFSETPDTAAEGEK